MADIIKLRNLSESDIPRLAELANNKNISINLRLNFSMNTMNALIEKVKTKTMITGNGLPTMTITQLEIWVNNKSPLHLIN